MAIDFDKFCVGKRGLGKSNADFGINDYYKYYKNTISSSSFASKYRSTLADNIVDEKTYKKILRDYFSLITQKVIMESQVVKIPLLGEFSIRKKKMDFTELSSRTSGLKIDYKRSKEARTIVHFTNEHRDNHSYRFFWQKPKTSTRLLMYTFRPNRQNKRLLAQILKNNMSIDYYEVKTNKIPYDDTYKASQL